MSDVTRQNVDGYTLLSYLKRGLMGDASGQDGEGCMLQSYRQRRAMGWRPGSSWWAGSLPLSIKPASIFLPIHFPPDGSVICRQRRCSAMTDAARCDGRCNALRWPLQRAAFSAPLLRLARDRVALAPLHAIPSKRAVRWKTPHSSFCSDRECRIQGYVADQRWRGITAFHLAQFLTLQKTDAHPRLPYPTWPSPGGWFRWRRDGCSHPSGERPDACR